MKNKKLSTYKFFFLSYAVILLVTISSLVVFYSQINKRFFQESQAQRMSLLSQLESNVNDKFRYSDALMNSMVTDTKLLQLAKGNSDASSYLDLMGDMRNVYHPGYFLNFSIYMDKTDEIVTEGVHMNAEDFFTYMYRVSNISYSDFKSRYLQSPRFRTLMPIVKIQTYNSDPMQVLPYIQSFPVDANQNKLGQIIVLLDVKDTVSLLDRLSTSTNSNVYVLDKENKAILSTAKAPALATDLLKRAQDENNFQTKSGGKSFTVNQVTSDENGWKYVMTTPNEVYFWENKEFTLNCLLIFLAYLIIGFLIAHFLAKRSCKPIREINDVIQSNIPIPDATGKNDFSLIKNTLIHQFDIGRKLNETIVKQQPIVRNAYLMSIVKGLEINYEEATEKLPALGVKLKSNKFVLVAFSFNMDSLLFLESNRLEEENITLARTLLQNHGSALMSDDKQCFFLDIDRNQFALLVNSADDLSDHDIISQLKKKLNAFIQAMLTQYKLKIDFGIGSTHEGLQSLPKGFDEAKKALSFCEKQDICEAICFDSIADENIDFYFPTDTEYLLVSNLRDGNYHAGRELLKNILDINHNMRISRKGIDALIDNVSAALVRVVNYTMAAKEQPLIAPDSLRAQLGPDVSLEAARTVFMEYISQIAGVSEPVAVSKTEILVNKIEEFVEKNAEGNMLDLNYVARHFNVTPQYVSNIFKKYKHEHIKDFIAKCKLEKAKGYLTNTDLSLRNISIQMGYADEMGIFRLFRKYENMTPGEYRAKNKA